MRPPFPYYGGKSRLASLIAGLLPPHQVYLEPFAGSAAVLLAKPPAPYEVLGDADHNVTTFFRALRDRPAELARACQLTPYARAEYVAAGLPVDPAERAALGDVELARRFWVRTCQSFNGNGTSPSIGRASWSVSIRQNTSIAATTAGRADGLLETAARLRTAIIDDRPAEYVIPHYDDPATVIYADPPYLGSTRPSLDAAKRRKADCRARRDTEVIWSNRPIAAQVELFDRTHVAGAC